MNKPITNFAIDIDDQTQKQFDECCSQEYVHKASLMPDAHSGYVAPIGSVFYTKNYVVPAWVGYDIGCGMIALKFKNIEMQRINERKDEIYDLVKKTIPMGTGKVNHIKDVSDTTKKKFKELLNKFREGKYDEDVYKFIKNKALSHLGSLGSGNHFIELNYFEDELWLVIHSGSRGIGKKAAKIYMIKSSNDENNYESTNPIKIDSKVGQEYMNLLDFGLDFALLNRMEMAYKLKDCLIQIFNKPEIDFELWTNKNHNHAIYEKEYLVHRKGATPAKKGEKGVIPANMRDGSFLVEGLGNERFLFSSSHGAGRKLSRSEAKKKFNLQEFQDSMSGIKGTVNERTIDECPMAYKDIFEVMQAQKDSVRIIKHLKPIINWKGDN